MEREAIVGALKRRWWIILALCAIGALLGGLPKPSATAQAQASISYYARHVLDIQSDGSTIYSDPIAVQRLVPQATGGVVGNRVRELGLDPTEVVAKIDLNTFQLILETTQPQPGLAVPLVDAVADELTAYLAESQDEEAITRLAANLERLSTLETEIDELQSELVDNPDDVVIQAKLDAKQRRYSIAFEISEELQESDSRLSLITSEAGLESRQEVSSSGLTAPNSRFGRAVFGGLVGLALGVGVALLLGRLDRRMRSRQQVEMVFGMRAQVVIPLVNSEHLQGIAVVPDRHDPLSDGYRTLRSVVGFVHAETSATLAAAHTAGADAPIRRGKITLVVSSSPGDGKTSVAANIAAAFVETGRRTVAINTDFRRPTLSSRILGTKPTPIPLSIDEIRSASARVLLTRTPLSGLALLDLAGVVASPGELARESARMIDELAGVADELIIDSSPLGLTAEVLELVPKADVIIVVTRLDHTSINSATRSMEILRSIATAPLLLTILGDTGERSTYGYYEYTSPTKVAEAGKRKRWKRSDGSA
jgi:Mrp family chromosome partitioning ATPase